MLVLIGESPCRGENAQDDKQAEQSIVGPWHADAVAILSEKGTKKTLPKNEQQPFNIIVSDKNLIMRVGDQKFAETSYVLDSKQTPCTIDVKFQDQEMRGIYELKGNNLKISLNDAKKERPKDFGRADNDMDLVLHRFKGEPLMMINSDGTDLHTLLSMPEYTSCGSPEWSHDGSKITFDTWRSVYGEDFNKQPRLCCQFRRHVAERPGRWNLAELVAGLQADRLQQVLAQQRHLGHECRRFG